MNDRKYFGALTGTALLFVLLFSGFLLTLIVNSLPALGKYGVGFLAATEWNPVTMNLGALPFILGTLLTSFLALAIALPFALAVAILTGEFLQGSRLARVAEIFINLLASIPSVVYGLWGLLTVVPLVRNLQALLGIPPYGVGILSASIVLAVMIVPFISSIVAESLKNVPGPVKSGAIALGLFRHEVVLGISLPYVRSGIAASVLLALGRALGETMAVTMLIGNATRLPTSIFSMGNSLASVIASQFNEAESDLHRAAMMYLGLVLLLLTLAINFIGKAIIRKGESRNAR